jgi:hypothetical protein
MRESSFDDASELAADSMKRHRWIPAFAGMTASIRRSVAAIADAQGRVSRSVLTMRRNSPQTP